jgi:hypothetical protein
MLMRGVTGVRQIVADYLSSQFPVMVDLARSQWELDEYHLPYPVKYNAYDPLTADVYPIVGSLVSRSTNFSRTDYDDAAAEEYRVRYATRVFMWARTPQFADGTWETPTYESALRVRDDLAVVLRATLLNSLSLGSGDGKAMLNEGSMAEEFFDAIKSSSESQRWMAGVTISFDLDVYESLSRTPVGTANTIEVDEGLLAR